MDEKERLTECFNCVINAQGAIWAATGKITDCTLEPSLKPVAQAVIKDLSVLSGSCGQLLGPLHRLVMAYKRKEVVSND